MRKRIKKKKLFEKNDAPNIFLTVDSPGWRTPEDIDIASLVDYLDIPNDSSSNVISHEFKQQDKHFEVPPDAKKLTQLDLAADNNFLYIWSNNRWKRIPLTEF